MPRKWPYNHFICQNDFTTIKLKLNQHMGCWLSCCPVFKKKWRHWLFIFWPLFFLFSNYLSDLFVFSNYFFLNCYFFLKFINLSKTLLFQENILFFIIKMPSIFFKPFLILFQISFLTFNYKFVFYTPHKYFYIKEN